MLSEAAARQKHHPAHNYILATGGFWEVVSLRNEAGYAQETIFDLPLISTISPRRLVPSRYSSSDGQPIFKAWTCREPCSYSPVDPKDKLLLTNLSVVGGALGGFDPLRERSLEGVALASGYWAASDIGEAHHD